MRLFLCGDVMTGRGIDQILPHPCDPSLYEAYMSSAQDYVALAEARSGPIPRPAAFDYIWGDAPALLDACAADLRIINLETSITDNGEAERKGINYRMHPANTPCLSAFNTDCCVLANNHVGDWGATALTNTRDALTGAGIASVGAGRDALEAARPATLVTRAGERLRIFAYALPSSGTPEVWAAGPVTAGVNLLADTSAASLERIRADVADHVTPDEVIIVSLHWGGNWGYEIPTAHRAFAHALIDSAGADIVFGHSSHHPKAIEVHNGRPIFYGCGDFINDYEGIGGHEAFRPDLVLGYLVDIEARRKRLASLEMIPFRIRKFRLHRTSQADAIWLCDRLGEQCGSFGTAVRLTADWTIEVVTSPGMSSRAETA
jgi:poly-gamma-glutamate synthesis protein (capsule biosynthesis protein)